MNKPRRDRRVSRTRRQLQQALMELILEKGYDAVKVEDITERADLGRTTFYLHFRDKEELLLESVEEVAEELQAQVGLLSDDVITSPLLDRAHDAILLVFRHAAEHATLYRIILSSGATLKVRQRIHDLILESARRFNRMTRLEEPSLRQVPPEYVVGYFASALLGYLTWWLEQGMPCPPEMIADYFVTLFFHRPQGSLEADLSQNGSPRL